jgi:AcrR family transcriptional regulator
VPSKPSTKLALSGLATRREVRRNGDGKRSDERWQEILTGAATTFRRTGYANATLEEIAAEVGINRASLYYYVGTKAELLIEMLHKPIFDMTKDLAVIQKSSLPPQKKLREAIHAHMRALDGSYPELFIFLAEHLHLLTIGQGEDRDVAVNARRYADLFTKIIEEGQKRGEMKSGIHPRIAMMGIVGMCNWTYRWYREDGAMTLTEIGEDFATMSLDGLVVPNRRRK